MNNIVKNKNRKRSWSSLKKRSCEHTGRWKSPTRREKGPQSETYLDCTFILDFPGSRAVGNRSLWLKPPGLGHFVMAALAD